MITREFVLAGRAIFTVANPHGERYTFKVTRGERQFLVGLLTGPDNTHDYQPFGILDEHGTHRTKLPHSIPVAVFQWAIRRIWKQDGIPEGYSIIHAGRCGRCGRLLTTPESVESGFGPKCQEKIS